MKLEKMIENRVDLISERKGRIQNNSQFISRTGKPDEGEPEMKQSCIDLTQLETDTRPYELVLHLVRVQPQKVRKELRF